MGLPPFEGADPDSSKERRFQVGCPKTATLDQRNPQQEEHTAEAKHPYALTLLILSHAQTDTCSLSSSALVSPAWASPRSKNPYISLQKATHRSKLDESAELFNQLSLFFVVFLSSFGCNLAKFLRETAGADKVADRQELTLNTCLCSVKALSCKNGCQLFFSFASLQNVIPSWFSISFSTCTVYTLQLAIGCPVWHHSWADFDLHTPFNPGSFFFDRHPSASDESLVSGRAAATVLWNISLCWTQHTHARTESVHTHTINTFFWEAHVCVPEHF